MSVRSQALFSVKRVAKTLHYSGHDKTGMNMHESVATATCKLVFGQETRPQRGRCLYPLLPQYDRLLLLFHLKHQLSLHQSHSTSSTSACVVISCSKQHCHCFELSTFTTGQTRRYLSAVRAFSCVLK